MLVWSQTLAEGSHGTESVYYHLLCRHTASAALRPKAGLQGLELNSLGRGHGGIWMLGSTG
jgi:hypothetical protein